jgi:hypothetical protein
MSYLKNLLLINGLMFIILTLPISFGHFDFAFSQRGGAHFGNEGQGGSGGQLGQGGSGGQLGQGGAGCPTGPNSIGGTGCPTNTKNTVSSTDNTNNVIVAGSSSTDSSSTDSSSTDSSLSGKTYIIHGPTDKTGGNPYSSTASCHANDLILGGGSTYDITNGNVTSFSAVPDSLSTFTVTITSSSNSDSALTVQAYAICYDNP